MKVKSLSHAQLLATPWTTAYQAPPSIGFSRQEYWSGVPLPSLQEYEIAVFLSMCTRVLSHFSRVRLCDPVACSPPGFSVHGILKARILEWVAMPSSRGSSQPRDGNHISHVSCTGRWFLFFTTHAIWEAPFLITGNV